MNKNISSRKVLNTKSPKPVKHNLQKSSLEKVFDLDKELSQAINKNIEILRDLAQK